MSYTDTQRRRDPRHHRKGSSDQNGGSGPNIMVEGGLFLQII